MKKFFSILLSIIFAVALLCTILLSVVRFNFSYSSITKLASEIMKPVSKAPVHNNGLFYPEDKIITLAQYDFDPSALENFDFSQIDLTNLDVNEIVQTYLKDAGIEVEPEFIAEVLASPDVTEFVDKYVGEVVDYMTGTKTELEINPDDVLKVVNTSIDMYEEHTGEVVEIDRTELKKTVTENIATAQENITATLDTAKEENADALQYLKYVNLVLSLKLFLICIAVCVVLALVIFLINMNVFAMFKYISIPSIVVGILIFIIAVVCAAVVPKIVPQLLADAGLSKGIFDGIWGYVAKVLAQMKIYGVVATLLGVVLCVLGFKLDKKAA